MVVLIVAYLPYAWLLTIDHSWSHRWEWIKLWPVLPGILPGILLRSSAIPALAIMPVVTAALLGLAIWIGARSRRSLVTTGTVVLTASAINSWMAYHAFLA